MLTTAFLRIKTAVDRDLATKTTLLGTEVPCSAPGATAPDSLSKGPIDIETIGANKPKTLDLQTVAREIGEKPEPSHDSRPGHSVQTSNAIQRLLNGIRVEEIMDDSVTWASPDDSIQDVFTKMGQHNIPYVLVGNNGKMAGIVSRSSVGRVIGTYLRPKFVNQLVLQNDAALSFKLNWSKFKIRWTMSHPVLTVKPDLGLSDTMTLMCKLKVRCLPVVNPKKQVLGLVTESHIFQKLQELLTSDT